MAASSPPDEFDMAWKASFDGARMVMLDNPPSVSARPGTARTAAVRLDKEAVAPRRSVSEVLELLVEF